jgi:hypothetical protein
VTQIGAALQRASSWPGLGAIGARVARFDDEIAAIRRAIESSGDVRDTASPALAEIRDALRQKRAKLRQGDRITLGSTELVFRRETESDS